MVYMDIDYMDSYKDFTINDDFGDFSEYVENLKKDNIRLIPIIDAGVKIEEGYDVYEEGVANNYFCREQMEVISLRRYGRDIHIFLMC